MAELHVHVFFDSDAATARDVAGGLTAATGIGLDHWLEGPAGPLPRGSFQVRCDPARLGEVVGWLMLHRRGLSVLVHPETGDDVRDHTEHAAWLGEPVPLRLDELGRSRSA